MGKRSDIPRIPQDKYDTPPDAVRPLLRHLAPETEFFEPCAGAGKLIDALEAAGHHCCGAIDIEPRDPRVQRGNMLLAQPDEGLVWITNPPWSRKLLHEFIHHAMKSGAVLWLLLDANWMFTRQAAPFMGLYCKMVVTIGRVCWFKETRKTGKDDAAWFLFTHEPGPTIFRGHPGGI